MSEKKKKTSTGKKKNTTTKKEPDKVVEKEEEIEEKEFKSDTTSVSIIDTQELKELMDEDLGISQEKKEKKASHVFVHCFLLLVCIASFISFGFHLVNQNTSIISLVQNLFITIFTILFTVVAITYRRNNKSLIFISSILLLGVFILGMKDTTANFKVSVKATPNFSGKSITEVLNWADKNKISVTQEYEYSDMIPEYMIISQDINSGTPLKEVKKITISISDGPNPSKEIMVPSMIGWDGDAVIEFVKNNYLSNVVVEFVESEKAQDTVISQSSTGTFKRDDELKLTFSYGEELGFEEVALVDLTNKSQFEVEFYMKQHQLNYKIERDFHKKIKKGFAISQNIKVGEKVKIHDEEVIITISKGPEIKIPDFSDYTMTKIAEWAIKNKVKITFEDQYDDTVKENHIIKSNYATGDIIEQGSVVKIVLSRGSLKMPKLESYQEFIEWAGKYNVPYEEVHEFSDSVPAGEIISYSYKTGDAIHNDDTITVTISDGMKKTVPIVVGLAKKEAISKLEKAGLKYSFVYRNSSEDKDIVLSQSIRAGSEISSGTTVTVTLSNGKKPETRNDNTSNNSNDNSNSSNNNNNNNNESTNPVTNNDDTPSCKPCTITGIKGIISTNIEGGYQAVANALTAEIKSQCPGIKVNISGDDTSGKRSGLFLSGFNGGNTDSCSTVSITLAK